MKKKAFQENPDETIKLVISSEDNPTYSEGLRLLLQREPWFEIVGISYDGEDVIRKAEELAPDVIIIGLEMLGLSGIEVTKRIKASQLHSRILILTCCTEEGPLLAAMEAGADGCLSTKASTIQLTDSLRAINFGDIIFDSRLAPLVMKHVRDAAKAASQYNGVNVLSRRQAEILKLTSKGLTNKEIGSALCVSERTVQAHLAVIFSKLSASSRAEAVTLALDKGLLSDVSP